MKKEEPKDSKKIKTSDVYLFLSYILKKSPKGFNDEIKFETENTKTIFIDKKEKEKLFEYKVVIFRSLLVSKKKKEPELNFKIGEKEYNIKFEFKNKHFIYELDLIKKGKFITGNKPIKQTLDNTQKIPLFL